MGAWGRLLGSLRAVRPLRVALVSVAAGLALGGAAILVLEARRPQPAAPESLLASIIEAAPSGARAALVRAVRPALIEALVADDTRAAAATLIAEVPSGVIVLDVEGALARRAVRHAATLVESRPAEAGDLLVAQLERAWLPKDARRDATAALWGLLRRRAHRLTAERALRLMDVAVRRGDGSILPPSTAVRVVGRIARAGFVPDAGGLPTAGRTLGPLVDALRRVDPEAAEVVGRVVGPASGHGPAELLIGQLDVVALDPDTPEVLRRDLAAGATVLQALVALRSLGDAERALTHLEPLVETWPADPSLVRLRALLLRRLGLHDEATAALGVWLGRSDTAPELRLLALAARRRGGHVDDELDRGAVLGRLRERSHLREEARMAAAAGWRHMADRLEADARALGSAVPLAVELLQRELFLADRRPDPSGAALGRAVETARALVDHALPGELTANARCAVARSLDRGGERRAALEQLDGGIDSLDTIGRCLWRLGLRDRARTTLDRAFDLAPSADHRARVALHRFTVADGLEDTLAWASKAASLGAASASGPLLEAQAQLYSRRGQLGDACEILDVLLRRSDVDEDDAAALVDVASFHRSRWDCGGDVGDLERAAALLERAAVIDNDPIVLANRADVLSHLGIVRALGATLRVDLLLPASTSPDFLELAALGGSRAAVLEAAKSSEELRAAVALHEMLARRAGETNSVAWLARWHELMGDEAALSQVWAELPSGLEVAPVPCASDPECVMALRDGWRRARVLLRRTEGRTRAAAAILLAAAARDLAAATPEGKALGVAETELRATMAREPLPEVEVALAQVLVAQVAAEKAPPGPDDLLPEVERLRSLPVLGEDPRVAEAVALVLEAEQGGHPPTQMDADIVGLRDPEAAASLRARWATRPGVLVARQLAYALAPSDPAAVLGLAAALEGRGSPETAAALRAEATHRGVLRR